MSQERQAVYTADEFERESHYLDTIVWEAIGVEAGTNVLVCGYGTDAVTVQRAIAAEASVTVIEHRESAIAAFAHLEAKLLRGSTSVIPARENTFDLAISFHYLHEIDPFFHAQVLSELARVARRVAVIEPAPPADALGKRIASLYSQAKRELGQFEYYQPIEYWKKLLQAVKADIAQHVFAFAKVPPREYLVDTIELLLHTIEVEQAPKDLTDELRRIAARQGAQLLPPPRFVLIGAALGELPTPAFTARPQPEPTPAPRSVSAIPRAAAPASTVSAEGGYEFPPVQPPAAAPMPPMPRPEPSAPRPAPSPQPAPPAEPFGVPGEPPPAFAPGFGSPFAVPTAETFGAPPTGISPSSTWQWEPPESSSDEEKPFGPGT